MKRSAIVGLFWLIKRDNEQIERLLKIEFKIVDPI